MPLVGERAQSLINKQGVDRSDIVFALFGNRLGSPTSEAVSGTAEEIDLAVAGGKPVHVYFSNAPIPNDADLEQVQALREFKSELENRGLLGEYTSETELSHEVWKAIEHDIVTLDLAEPSLPSRKTEVNFLVQPKSEKEQTSLDSRGKVKYRTRSWLEVTNRGDVDAEQVSFQAVPENSGFFLSAPEEPITVHAGQMRKLVTAKTLAGPDRPRLRITWVESGEQKQKEFHI